MADLREPKLGVAVGRKGCGKTFQTEKMIRQYVLGNPAKGVLPRRALIVDVNDEFESIKPLSVKDVVRFSNHPIIEARRIRPFTDSGVRMTIKDIQATLFTVLNDFRGGLLLIEDVNRYVSDNLPMDLIGAICTNRHTDTDIIMHFQNIARVSPKIWQNLNWLRFHKNSTSVDTYKDRFEDKYEILKLVENYVNSEFHAGNERFFCYVDIENEKIKGVDRAKFSEIVDKYLQLNSAKIINPLVRSRDLVTGAKLYTVQTAAKQEKERILKLYLG